MVWALRLQGTCRPPLGSESRFGLNKCGPTYELRVLLARKVGGVYCECLAWAHFDVCLKNACHVLTNPSLQRLARDPRYVLWPMVWAHLWALVSSDWCFDMWLSCMLVEYLFLLANQLCSAWLGTTGMCLIVGFCISMPTWHLDCDACFLLMLIDLSFLQRMAKDLRYVICWFIECLCMLDIE